MYKTNKIIIIIQIFNFFNLMQWTLDQLRQFIVTAECGSFSAAARKLSKAQSAVSTAIGLLEVDLGVELFDRSHRNAQLTNEGHVLLLEAKELFRQVEAFDYRARAFNLGSDSKLSIGFDEALPYSAISMLIREISVKFPDLQLTILNGTTKEVAEYVNLERADIAFHIIRNTLSPCYEQVEIGKIPQGVFVVQDHPLTQLERVEQKNLVHYRQLIIDVQDELDIPYSPKIWKLDSFYIIAELVVDSLGWAILPVNIGNYHTYSKPLVQLNCPTIALPDHLVRMIWCQGRSITPTVKWVENRFTELLELSQ